MDYPNESLKEALETKGISQTRAAFDLGVSLASMNRWALGWAEPKARMKAKIAAYLGIKEDEIWREGGK